MYPSFSTRDNEQGWPSRLRGLNDFTSSSVKSLPLHETSNLRSLEASCRDCL